MKCQKGVERNLSDDCQGRRHPLPSTGPAKTTQMLMPLPAGARRAQPGASVPSTQGRNAGTQTGSPMAGSPCSNDLSSGCCLALCLLWYR
eukprot:1468288-Prymnesium_polylepis.1